MLAIAMSDMLFTWSSAPLSAFRAAEGAGPHGLQQTLINPFKEPLIKWLEVDFKVNLEPR